MPEQLASWQDADLPLERWALDESRFGLHTIQRRRLTLRGVKPLGVQQQEFKNFYSYGIVAPRTGEGDFATRLTMNAGDFQAFIDPFAARQPARLHVILLDNARRHHAKSLTLPDNVALLFLPPYAPELNPCERVWLALKDGLAWRCFADLVELQDAIAARLAQFDEASFASLVGYPFLCDAMQTLAA